MANSRGNEDSNSLLRFFNKEWKSLSVIFGLATALILGGFSVGAYYKESRFEIEKFRVEQDCNNRVHQLEVQLNDAKLEKYQKAVDNLTDVVKQIQQADHEK